MIQLIFLVIALSMDSLGIGVSYGIRKIRLSPISILIVSLISILFASMSVWLGNFISIIFSERVTSFLSIIILIIMGIFIIKKGFEKEDDSSIENDHLERSNKIYTFFIKSLGITINVIKTPSYCDLDKSLKIEPKEALYLGIALSIDSIGAGIAISSLSIYAYLFPVLIMLFQLIFLTGGILFGRKLNLKSLDETKISILSGSILILIGFLRMITN